VKRAAIAVLLVSACGLTEAERDRRFVACQYARGEAAVDMYAQGTDTNPKVFVPLIGCLMTRYGLTREQAVDQIRQHRAAK
jgi:hypothetical protein